MPPSANGAEQKAAELALTRMSARLTRAGAHSFSVGFVNRGGKRRIGVLVNFPKAIPPDLPNSVEVTVGGKKIAVPVHAKAKVPPFAPDVLPPQG